MAGLTDPTDLVPKCSEVVSMTLICPLLGQVRHCLGRIKIPVFRVTRPYLKILEKPRIFFRSSGKKYIFMHFKMHKIIFFQKKKCVPTLPKIFRSVTRNTLIFYLALCRVCLRFLRHLLCNCYCIL